MKTAIEILDDHGCPTLPFDEMITMYYPNIINAMEEYANQKWISVHSLPTEKKLYNIYFSNKAGSHIDTAYWNGENFTVDGKDIYTNVTHWTLLPTPPKSN